MKLAALAAVALLACSPARSAPAANPSPLAQSGTASWYGEPYRGRAMANGRPFNPDALTCASWFFPLGAILRVQAGRRIVFVVVTDRGPRSDLVRAGRVIDLSRRAFELIAPLDVGLVPVVITKI